MPVIAVWIALACITFISFGSLAERSWLLLIIVGTIPPAMLLWLWNEDRPQLLGALRERGRR
jgi:hypothetical protein